MNGTSAARGSAVSTTGRTMAMASSGPAPTSATRSTATTAASAAAIASMTAGATRSATSSPATLPAPAAGMIFRRRTELFGNGGLCHRLAEQLLDDPEFILFLFTDERKCNAIGLRP